jgi:O-methyltransferase
MTLKAFFMKWLPNLEAVRILFYLPKIREFDFSNSKCFTKKQEMYDYIDNKFVSDTPLSYLEFGVFKGASIKYWTDINKNKQSEFVGFDTFTGLPEPWHNLSISLIKNHFDTSGQVPDIKDERCRFVKGMFQDTLVEFLKKFNPKEMLVIHNDSDLYSSTMFMLVKVHHLLIKGSIIIFDEFSSPLHEMRALNDFASSHLFNYRIIGHTEGYRQVAIEAS